MLTMTSSTFSTPKQGLIRAPVCPYNDLWRLFLWDRRADKVRIDGSTEPTFGQASPIEVQTKLSATWLQRSWYTRTSVLVRIKVFSRSSLPKKTYVRKLAARKQSNRRDAKKMRSAAKKTILRPINGVAHLKARYCSQIYARHCLSYIKTSN